mmetsp:Transcript_14251/g.42031  ORF Transcript_14251/g.42031 Transcript_14251/m.42031 type:complete len:293 (-) Transcript_14251:409-1287(-)
MSPPPPCGADRRRALSQFPESFLQLRKQSSHPPCREAAEAHAPCRMLSRCIPAGDRLLGGPGPALAENEVFTVAKVALHHFLKADGWLKEMGYHAKVDIFCPNCRIVRGRAESALVSHHLSLKPWLIEVRIWNEDEALNTDDNLEEARGEGIPVFAGFSSPSAEEAQADLAVAVEVRVESDLASTRGLEFHLGRDIGVVDGDEGTEEEEPSGVGSPLWAGNKELDLVHAVLAGPEPHRGRCCAGQGLREVCVLLHEATEALPSAAGRIRLTRPEEASTEGGQIWPLLVLEGA